MIKSEIRQSSETVPSVGNSLKAVVQGVIFALVILVGAFAILALVYTYTPMPDRFLSPAVNVIGITDLLISGIITSLKAGNRGWLHGAFAGLLYALVRYGAGLAVFKCYVPSEGILQTFLFSALLGAIGGIAGINIAGKSLRKKRRKKSGAYI